MMCSCICGPLFIRIVVALVYLVSLAGCFALGWEWCKHHNGW